MLLCSGNVSQFVVCALGAVRHVTLLYILYKMIYLHWKNKKFNLCRANRVSNECIEAENDIV